VDDPGKESHKEMFEFEEEITREIIYFDRNTLKKKNPVGIKEEKDGTFMNAFFLQPCSVE